MKGHHHLINSWWISHAINTEETHRHLWRPTETEHTDLTAQISHWSMCASKYMVFQIDTSIAWKRERMKNSNIYQQKIAEKQTVKTAEAWKSTISRKCFKCVIKPSAICQSRWDKVATNRGKQSRVNNNVCRHEQPFSTSTFQLCMHVLLIFIYMIASTYE